MTNGEFKEVGRIVVSDTTEVVLSELHNDDKLIGYTINKYVTSEKFTGFAKGAYIPVDMMIDFLKLFPKEMLEDALEEKK